MTLIEEQTAAWEQYAEARRKADRTLKMVDGIAAAKAWCHFVDIFLEEDRTPPSAPNVVRFPEARQ